MNPLGAALMVASLAFAVWIVYATAEGLWWAWRTRSRTLRLWVLRRREVVVPAAAGAAGTFWVDLWLVGLRPLPRFEAGQYLTLRPGAGRPARAYSLANGARWPWAYRLIVQVEPEGLTSRWVAAALRVGRSVRADPPRGRFGWRAERHDRPLVLVAGGVGITPMLAIVDRIARRGGHRHPVTLFHSVRDARLAVDAARLKALAASSGWLHYRLFVTGGAPSAADADVVRRRMSMEDLLAAPGASRAAFFFCGSNAFMAALMSALRARGVDDARLHHEAFALVAGAAGRVAGCRLGPTEFAFEAEHGTLLDALEAAGCAVAADCRVGDCGACRLRRVSGTVRWLVPEAEAACSRDEVLACCTQPLEPVALERV